MSLNSSVVFIVAGDGVRDFFFRVASLTFEANVLSELEKSGSRHVGDIISKSVCAKKVSLLRGLRHMFQPFPVFICQIILRENNSIRMSSLQSFTLVVNTYLLWNSSTDI